MLLCLVVQVATLFWCVRYYVRQSTRDVHAAGIPVRHSAAADRCHAGDDGRRTSCRSSLWGALFVYLGEFDAGAMTRSITRR